MSGRPTVAVFRPDDGRLEDAAEYVESLGAEAVPDAMIAIEETGATPRSDADFAVLTSTTGVDVVAAADWDPGSATLCAIGETTASALREAGYAVDRVPGEFSSAGLVAELEADVTGARVEIARSDRGSTTLPDGLEAAGAYVHETVLYRLARPESAGRSAALAASGHLDGAVFTSPLTVEHFLEAAADRGVREAALAGLGEAVVGVIGEPTRETATASGVGVDVVPDTAGFEALADRVVEQARSRSQTREREGR